MSSDPSLSRPSESGSSESFPDQTRQTLIDRLLDPDEAKSGPAMAEFCEIYWTPCYYFLRRIGDPHEKAEEIVQGFILQNLLKRNFLERWDKRKARLRTYLLAALKNYRRDEHRKENAKKRGGGVAVLRIEVESEAKRYQNLPVDESTAEMLFDREWGRSAAKEALSRVAAIYAEKNENEEFQLLVKNLRGRFLDGTKVEFKVIAESLGTSSGNVKQKMMKLKAMLREELHAVVSDTVPEGAVEKELQSFADHLKD